MAATIAFTTFAATTGQAAPAPSAPKAGGTVKVGIFDTFPGWCSNNNPANSALMAVRTVYETLFEKTASGRLVGLLAESGRPSADLKTWTVKLRSGIKFHNGTPMNADSVKKSLDIAFAHNLGKAAAIGALSTAVTFTANVNKIEVAGPLTLRFLLDRPQNDFTSTLYASGRFFIRAPEQYDSTGSCVGVPIGTGPFQVEAGYRWADNATMKDNLTVVKNKDYWRVNPDTKQKLPYLDKIVFTNIKESSQRSAALKRGTVDAAMFSSASDATFIQDLRLPRNRRNITEFKSPTEYFPSFWFNQATISGVPSPFKNKVCREAVALALDRRTYVRTRTRGEARVADSLVGPSNVMYTKKNFLTFNLNRAKAKAAECKTLMGGKFEFTIPSDTSSVSLNNAKEIQRQMAAAGITMNIDQKEAAVVISTAFRPAKNGWQAIPILLFEGTDVGFNMPFIVTNTFTTNSQSPAKGLRGILGDILNLNRHTDTKVDELFFKAQAQKSAAAAKRGYAEATAYVQSETLSTSILHFYYTFFANKKLGGIGKLRLPIRERVTQRVVSNWGIDWTGVYLTR